jgi:hypothetical protein
MSYAQRLASDLNRFFGPGPVDTELVGRLSGEDRLGDIAYDLALDLDDDLRVFLRDYLNGMPRAIEAAIRGVLLANLAEGDNRRPITFAWVPAYDWEVTVWDVADARSRGGITVLLGSRYPDDEHPLSGA